MKRTFITNILVAVCMLASIGLVSGCGNDENGWMLFTSGLENLADNNLPMAYRQFQQSLVEFEKQNDSIGSFSAKAHLSLLCSMIGQKDEGYELLKSSPYYHVREKENYSSQYYLRLRAYYSFIIDNDYKTSIHYIKKLLELDSSDFPDEKTWYYMDLANLSEVFYMTGQYNKSWEIINYLESNPLDDNFYLSQVYYIHALLLKAQGKADSAYVYAQRSIAQSVKIQSPENEANSLKILMHVDSVRGDMKTYVAHRNSYDSLTNKVKGVEMAHHMAVIKEQHKYDLALKESEKRHMANSLWSGGGLLVAVSASIIIFLLYKQNKLKLKQEMEERKRLDAEMEYKKMENELLSLKMEQTQHELKETINENVKTIKKLAVIEDKKAPSTRLMLLEATLKSEHLAFLKHIEDMYPALTHNDKLILGFMRMGLTPQEVTAALGISLDSFQKARYRLRKKMNMGSIEELQGFVDSCEG